MSSENSLGNVKLDVGDHAAQISSVNFFLASDRETPMDRGEN